MIGRILGRDHRMFDARPDHGTPIDLDKLRSLNVGRIHRPAVVEGRSHPETGRAWKSTTTEAGTITEHATPDDRVDALVTPETARQVGNGR